MNLNFNFVTFFPCRARRAPSAESTVLAPAVVAPSSAVVVVSVGAAPSSSPLSPSPPPLFSPTTLRGFAFPTESAAAKCFRLYRTLGESRGTPAWPRIPASCRLSSRCSGPNLTQEKQTDCTVSSAVVACSHPPAPARVNQNKAVVNDGLVNVPTLFF